MPVLLAARMTLLASASPRTARSLVVCGPAVKDRFLVMGRHTGETWWQYGAALEPAEDAAEKRMSVERLREMRGQLNEWVCFSAANGNRLNRPRSAGGASPNAVAAGLPIATDKPAR